MTRSSRRACRLAVLAFLAIAGPTKAQDSLPAAIKAFRTTLELDPKIPLALHQTFLQQTVDRFDSATARRAIDSLLSTRGLGNLRELATRAALLEQKLLQRVTELRGLDPEGVTAAGSYLLSPTLQSELSAFPTLRRGIATVFHARSGYLHQLTAAAVAEAMPGILAPTVTPSMLSQLARVTGDVKARATAMRAALDTGILTAGGGLDGLSTEVLDRTLHGWQRWLSGRSEGELKGLTQRSARWRAENARDLAAAQRRLAESGAAVFRAADSVAKVQLRAADSVNAAVARIASRATSMVAEIQRNGRRIAEIRNAVMSRSLEGEWRKLVIRNDRLVRDLRSITRVPIGGYLEQIRTGRGAIQRFGERTGTILRGEFGADLRNIQEWTGEIAGAAGQLADLALKFKISPQIVATTRHVSKGFESGRQVLGAFAKGDLIGGVLSIFGGVGGVFGGGPTQAEVFHQEIMGKFDEVLAGQKQILENLKVLDTKIDSLTGLVVRQHTESMRQFELVLLNLGLVQQALTDNESGKLSGCLTFVRSQSEPTYARRYATSNLSSFEPCMEGLEALLLLDNLPLYFARLRPDSLQVWEAARDTVKRVMSRAAPGEILPLIGRMLLVSGTVSQVDSLARTDARPDGALPESPPDWPAHLSRIGDVFAKLEAVDGLIAHAGRGGLADTLELEKAADRAESNAIRARALHFGMLRVLQNAILQQVIEQGDQLLPYLATHRREPAVVAGFKAHPLWGQNTVRYLLYHRLHRRDTAGNRPVTRVQWDFAMNSKDPAYITAYARDSTNPLTFSLDSTLVGPADSAGAALENVDPDRVCIQPLWLPEQSVEELKNQGVPAPVALPGRYLRCYFWTAEIADGVKVALPRANVVYDGQLAMSEATAALVAQRERLLKTQATWEYRKMLVNGADRRDHALISLVRAPGARVTEVGSPTPATLEASGNKIVATQERRP